MTPGTPGEMLEREEHTMPEHAPDVELRDALVSARLRLAGESTCRIAEELQAAPSAARLGELSDMLAALGADLVHALERP